MFRRNVLRISVIVLTAALGLAVITGCKKKPPQPRQPQTATAPKSETTAAQPVIGQDTNIVSAESEPIAIVLPKPVFIGTPQNFQGITNLEKPLGRPRDPFYAPKGTKNVALGRPVTASDEQLIIGELAMLTDGDKEAADGSFVEMAPGKQYITIDLGASFKIYAIVIWHFHKQPRVYKDVAVQVSEDPDFITNVRTLFNNDNDNTSGLGVGQDLNYVETAEGKLIDAKGIVARYVRCYSNGNNTNDLNNYVEVEVYGLP
jgi:hypothetical protein